MKRYKHYPASKVVPSQAGIGSFKAVAAIAGIGLTFLFLFVFVGGAGNPKTDSNSTQATPPTSPTTPPATTSAASSQPAVIRIPDGYSVYTNKDYKFSFGYPTPWEGAILLNIEGGASTQTSLKTTFFNNYAFGTTSVLNGQMIAYVAKQDAFKSEVTTDGAIIAPVKLGEGFGWKVVQAGPNNPNLNVGDSYNIKATKYQTGIPIYNFTSTGSNSVQSRWVFQSGENFVSIALPILTGVNGAKPSTADIALYTIISNNVAKTARPTN